MESLKPCLCGSTDVQILYGWDDEPMVTLYCASCGADVEETAATEEEA